MMNHSIYSLSKERKKAIKSEVMSFVVAHPRELRKAPRSSWLLPWIGGLATLSVLLFAGGVMANTSNPGDMLYPVKRWSEERRLDMTQNPQARDALLRELAERRIREFEQSYASGQTDSSELIWSQEQALESVLADTSDEELRLILSEKLAVLNEEHTDVPNDLVPTPMASASAFELNSTSTESATLVEQNEATGETEAQEATPEANFDSKTATKSSTIKENLQN